MSRKHKKPDVIERLGARHWRLLYPRRDGTIVATEGSLWHVWRSLRAARKGD